MTGLSTQIAPDDRCGDHEDAQPAPAARDALRIARPPALTHRDVLVVAVPIILSNLTTPLIGMVDTAVLGRVDQPELIGAVAIGSTIFSILYWAFAFLRMGTTGLTAQAEGAADADAVGCVLLRALLIAVVAGLAILLLQKPIMALATATIGGSEPVLDGTRIYFGMRIWGAPAALANFAIFGWLVGLGRAKAAFVVQLLLNGLNIGLAIVLGLWLGMTVKGVGLAACLADVLAAVVGLGLAFRHMAARGTWPSWGAIFEGAGIRRMLAINRDIMIRTLCVQLAFSFFTARLAGQGDVALAANAILLQLVTFSAYVLDGFAFSAETLVGQSIGARDEPRFLEAMRISSLWATVCALAAGLSILTLGNWIIEAMTVSASVRMQAHPYLGWAAIGPVAGMACYQLDGVFIGATRTADMRNMMVVSVAVFLVSAIVLQAQFGMHGLWLSLVVFYVVRALTLWTRLPALKASVFGPPTGAIKGY